MTTPTPNPPISSEPARRLVNHFLLMEVSTMLAAATPELVIGARPIWCVPVWIGFLQQGRYAVGALDVDVQRGALLEREQGVTAIRVRATQIAGTLLAYRPNAQVGAEVLAPNAMRAENLSTQDLPLNDNIKHRLGVENGEE